VIPRGHLELKIGHYKMSEQKVDNLVALRLPPSKPHIVELTAFESLRTAVG